jgi:putative DNA primase/helicase
LRFDKTYVRNAIATEGQLEADPRFKDDEKFILEQIAPAMLNKLLERLPLLLSEGIDYKATKDAMQKAQEESRHLWQFVRDVGIEVQTGGRIYVKDLWEKLQEWYQAAGILELEYTEKGREKLIWHDLSNKYDAPVKAINQVLGRFSEIFPKIQKRQHTEGNSLDPRKSQWYLSGIAFVQNSGASEKIALLALLPCTEGDTALSNALLEKESEAASKATSKATTLAQSQSRASRAISSPFAEVCNLIAQFTDAERQKLVELLTQPQPLHKKVTPEDAQKIRDIALLWWPEYYPEQMQALLRQMYAWQAPGTKYDVATLAEWLEGEDELIRDRITELVHLREG